jgi:putative flippase GtrA
MNRCDNELSVSPLQEPALERKNERFAQFVRQLSPGEFTRYLLIGGWNTAFGYSTYAALTWLLSRHIADGYIYAAVLSNIISISVAFLGYKWFVFRTKGNYLREWMRCFMVYGTAALPNLLLLPVVVNALIYMLHIPPGNTGHATAFQLSLAYMNATFVTAPYIGGAILTATTVLFSFFGHKYFSFRRRTAADEESGKRGPSPLHMG